MRTRRQAELVGRVCAGLRKCVLTFSYIISRADFDPCLHPDGRLSIYPARAAARAALELRRAPHFDVGH